MSYRVRGGVSSLLVLVSVFAIGCQNDGPPHAVRGRVTFKGQPIPSGWVVFTPDTAQKNTGPQGYAIIRDGVFDTSRSPGMGTNGGPMIVRIDGCDGRPTDTQPSGAPIMAPYETRVTLAEGATTIELDVPASWASKRIPAPVP